MRSTATMLMKQDLHTSFYEALQVVRTVAKALPDVCAAARSAASSQVPLNRPTVGHVWAQPDAGAYEIATGVTIPLACAGAALGK